MKINTINSLLISLSLVSPGQILAQGVVNTTQQGVNEVLTPIISGPQEGESLSQYLNRGLQGSRNEVSDDSKLRKTINDSRIRFNFFIANSLSLPVSIVEDDRERKIPVGSMLPFTSRPPIKIEGIPDWIQGSLGTKEVSIKITRSF